MNENIDLTKILKSCPVGWHFWSSVYGDVEFIEIYKPVLCKIRPREDGWLGQEIHDSEHPILFDADGFEHRVSSRGEMIKGCGECTFFPSRDQRDWSKFTAPWYKEDKLIKPKFKVGDWIISSVLGIAHIIGVNDSNEYQLEYIDGKQKFSSIDYVNYEYDKWTINDAKDGDVLCCKSGWMCIFKAIDNHTNTFSSYCSMSSDKYFFSNGSENHTLDKNFIKAYNGDIYPATKEQHDALMKAMNEAGYEWDIKKKELKKLVPNRFDPKTLKPFDKVLVRDYLHGKWTCGFFSHIVVFDDKYKYNIAEVLYEMCIPYNDDTKHLVGTTEEAPEYYRYWEN